MVDSKPTALKVARACDRCKKQKLKCDIERPCTLCTRSGVACSTTTGNSIRASPAAADARASRMKRKRKRNSDDLENDHIITTEASLEYQARSQPVADSSLLSSVNSSDIEAPIIDGSSKLKPMVNTDRVLTTASFQSPVFSFNDSQHRSATSALPGGTDQQSLSTADLLFFEPHLPPAEVVEALIDSYFDTVHWFMFILHEASFRQQARRVVALGPRIKAGPDADFAALLMMVIALGAQYAGRNPRWRYRDLMAQHSIDLVVLVSTLTRQVRAHLLDSLERCQLEAVQTCILLGTYYMYHGNPNSSWSVLGLAVKAAYALGMHREVDWRGDFALLQARKRAWGHTYIADTFAAVIYGRPATIDRTFCDVCYPDECDDTIIPIPLIGYLNSINDGKHLSKLTYHTHKYRLYEIKAQIISKIYTLRARASFQASGSGIPKLVKTVQSFDSKLKTWKDNLPTFFKQSRWTNGEGDPADALLGLQEDLSEAEEQIKQHLIMQKIALQLLYDYILILLHRPLLEYRMSSRRQRQSPESSLPNPFPTSFETCMNAAMRISYTPANRFEYHCPMALVTMHMLTAGVILCIPATMYPLSILAHKAKGAVVRMIRIFKKLSAQTPVVAQCCTILEELMKVVLKRELELVLQPEESEDPSVDLICLPEDLTTSNEDTENVPRHRSRENSPRAPPQAPAYPPEPETQMQRGLRSEHPTSMLPTGGDAIAQGPFSQAKRNNEVHPSSFGDNSMSTVSLEGLDSQAYDFIDAEPDHGFNLAFGALERVMQDVAPSEWINPAWMQPYEGTELYPMAGDSMGGNSMGFAPEDIAETFERNENRGSSLGPSSAYFNTYPDGSPQASGGISVQWIDRSRNQSNRGNFGPSWQ